MFEFQLWVTFDLLRYSAQVCTEICDHLNIELFRIPNIDQRHTNQRSGTQSVTDKNGTTITTRSQSRKYSKNKYEH